MRLERTKNAARNAAFGYLSRLILLFFPFITRSVFLRVLDSEYLGLNGLFTSFLSLLSLSELGIGASITYALGSILGGAFAPTIAAAVVQATGSTVGVTAYLLVATFIGLLAAASLRDRTGIPLGPEHEAEQAERHFTLSR